MILSVYGADRARVKERTNDLRRKFAEKYDPSSLNIDIVQAGADDWTPESLRTLVSAAPFLTEKRMVVVRGLASELNTDTTPEVQAALSSLPSTTVVLLSDEMSAETFDASKLAKLLATLPEVHPYPLVTLKGPKFAAWVEERSKKYGLSWQPGILARATEAFDEDPERADLELRKLADYMGGAEVGPKDLETLLAVSPEEDVFAFMNAFARGEKAVVEALTRQEASGTDPFALFGLLLRELRLLTVGRLILEKGDKSPAATLAKTMSLPPFAAEKIITGSRRASLSRLTALEDLARILDLEMKRGLSPSVALARLTSGLLATRA